MGPRKHEYSDLAEFNVEKPKWLAGTVIGLGLVIQREIRKNTFAKKNTTLATRPERPLEFH